MHWLVRPETIRKLWIAFIAILALTVVAEFFVHGHPHFGIDGWPAFSAWFGFGSCVIMVFGSKLIGMVLKRPDTYYDE
ncbi:hypothetical protein G3580_15895 [Nitrogeniibacter mangrovi]|uniref:Uncharacterized protein n=1 Tax=Nitrogeniibacter mangrovi TaxID=2016596 RepID=A0A6C1B5K6_9RHOO|nr:hypothetical protein [Nitrogeniibacter mangrovi]QID18971.1 hypothetical protein G3580_15895 [Nitrogeniibacter mangrovi]